METELTIHETERLKELEHVISDGLFTYFEVGSALMQIRDQKLYRATHTTFELYCRDTFQISRAQAYRLIDSYNVQSNIASAQSRNFKQKEESLQLETKEEEEKREILDNLRRSILQQPQNESQVRPLTKLPPEKQAKAWQKAIETAPDGKITAKHVQQVVNSMTGKVTEKPKQDQTRDEAPGALELAEMSISQLKQISSDDPQKPDAYHYVEAWLENNVPKKQQGEIPGREHWEHVVEQLKKLNEYIYENCGDSFTLEEDIYQDLFFNSSHTVFLITHGKHLYSKYKEGGLSFGEAKRRDLEIERWLKKRRDWE